MRQYRAKVKSDDSVVSKRWAYGDRVKIGARVYIVLDDAEVDSHSHGEEYIIGIIEVIEESVGQDTGVKDRDGVEIYEGERVQGDWQADRRRTVSGIVTYYGKYGLYALKDEDGVMVSVVWDGCIIIGDTTDDPGLLKEQDHEKS